MIYFFIKMWTNLTQTQQRPFQSVKLSNLPALLIEGYQINEGNFTFMTSLMYGCPFLNGNSIITTLRIN